jgi:hypothetical protein
MEFGPARVACRSVLIGFTVFSSALGQDVSVDKLLNKLPPPEKLAKAAGRARVTTTGSRH